MGEYVVEVHGCDLPEMQHKYAAGTIWKCECGIHWEKYYASGGGVPGAWSWYVVQPGRINKDTGAIMSNHEWREQCLAQVAHITYKKRWWQR